MSFKCGACGSNVPADAPDCPSCGFHFGVLPPSTTPQPPEGAFAGTAHFFAYALLILAAPAFLESAFEMYGLTLVRGQQMLFFSIIHTASALVTTLLFLSWICFIGLVLHSGGVAVLRVFSAHRCKDNFGSIFTVVFAITLTHTILLTTYDYWARLF
jgi:hypothetical protein